MILQVKVKVKISTIKEFASKLISGQLDRSAIIGETYCEKNDPAVGVSYWNVDDIQEFENMFSLWKQFYETYEIKEVITPKEAMFLLLN